jgi:alkylation response protein AidB-like acyl-CoA dehydrogenase
MDMDFTPEQDLLRESVRRTCERHCAMDVVRKLENDPIGYSPAMWSALTELGLSEMTLLDATIVYEELGRALVPSPHFVSCVLAAGVLKRLGATELVPPVETGEQIVTVAWLEPDGGFTARGITARVDGGRLTGEKRHVQFARAADRLLVLARDGEDIVVAVVDPSADGVALEQQLAVASDTQYTVRFDNTPVETVFAGAWSAWNETMLDGAILLAAQAVGGARAALDLAVDYAKTRQQFDKPLGAFQALAHYLADAATAVDGAQTLTWEAAWARTVGGNAGQLAPMAKLYAGRTFRDVTATAVQIFGGVGFTVEFDIQLYFRRAKSLQLNWWDDRHLEELIAETVLT